MVKIDEILVEANLTEAQVNQVVGIVTEAVGTERAKLREAHIEEIAKIEESRSNAVTALMKDLAEANKQLKEANKKVCEDELDEKAFKMAAACVEEALTRVQPVLKQARAYVKLRESMAMVQESFRRAFGASTGTSAIHESSVVDQSAEVESLRAEVFALRRNEIFATLTKDLAESTKIRVAQLVDMAHSNTLDEYTELVEVAISHNKNISPNPPPAVIEERNTGDSMAKYLRVLAKSV